MTLVSGAVPWNTLLSSCFACGISADVPWSVSYIVRVVYVHFIKRGKLVIKLLSMIFFFINIIYGLNNFIFLRFIIKVILHINVWKQFVIFIRLYSLVMRHHEVYLLRVKTERTTISTSLLLVRRKLMFAKVIFKASTKLGNWSLVFYSLSYYFICFQNFHFEVCLSVLYSVFTRWGFKNWFLPLNDFLFMCFLFWVCRFSLILLLTNDVNKFPRHVGISWLTGVSWNVCNVLIKTHSCKQVLSILDYNNLRGIPLHVFGH